MKTIKEWAEYYQQNNLNVWICPYEENTEDFYKEWKEINTENLYIEKSNSFDWTSASCISLVTGKKGCMILSFRKDAEIGYSEARLKDVLSILGLPENYFWVIESQYHFSIVLDVHTLPKGRITKRYRDFNLIWEEYCMLPPGNSNYPCGFRYGLPTAHPMQLSWQDFENKIEQINKIHLNVDETVKEQRRKNELYGKLALGCFILIVILAITIFYATVFHLGYTKWFMMFCVMILAVSGLIYMMSHK